VKYFEKTALAAFLIDKFRSKQKPVVLPEQLRKMQMSDADYEESIQLQNKLAPLKLYEKVYVPTRDKAEKNLSIEDPGAYALAAVNKSLSKFKKTYKRDFAIIDTGPSEEAWKVKFNARGK
jgi:hypothetical protein